MTKTKTIRLSEETYEMLLTYKAELEITNKRSLSFDDAVELLFVEVAGYEYEAATQRLEEKSYTYAPKAA